MITITIEKISGFACKISAICATPARILAIYAHNQRVICTRPSVPIVLQPGIPVTISIFTNCTNTEKINFITNSRLESLFVKFNSNFDAKVFFPNEFELRYEPELIHGFAKIQNYFLSMSGDCVIRGSKVYSLNSYIEDFLILYMKLGALSNELLTLREMEVPNNFLIKIEQEIKELKNKLNVKETEKEEMEAILE